MALLDELKTLGVNIDEATERFMGNVSLYEKMLGKLPDMIEHAGIQPDFDCNDYAGTTEKAHAIKGATGNLSIIPLYEAYTEIVSLLRNSQPEQAKIILQNILPVQNEIIACIKKYT